ncbi:MAG: S-methyl-5-thioribose-1-phosphate isomerase [Jatrophihabitans sp.]|uniref:S-methyl-5-thioribose-1-phosphate isomerase n=1 Tax=Jatrophihabitans sp. TaxID=1932789 RepID=UPI003F7D455D
MRTIDWRDDGIVLIEQTRLPDELVELRVTTVDMLVDAIRRLAVRGAPALGAAGALGVLLAVRQAAREGWSHEQRAAAITRLRAARPTAVNLAWGVDRVVASLEASADVEAAALAVLDEDAEACRAIGDRGAQWLLGQVGAPRVRVHTHCNAGALATVEYGTALGVVRSLASRGRLGTVYADETRPLLQGARLTAWELAVLGADYRVVVDGAGAGVIARGLVDAVVVGADRITANGDVINKVGTFPLALAAARAGVPFVVAAPESTVDTATADGAAVEIEERADDEVLTHAGRRTAPPGARAYNPAFDLTPADLVTAVVTERRLLRPAAGETFA